MSRDNRVRNNILIGPDAPRGSIKIAPDSLAGLSSDYNVLTPRLSRDDGRSTLDLVRWRAAGQDAHSLPADPGRLFLNPAAHDYRLRPSAAAVDAGYPAAAPPTAGFETK